MDAAFDFFGQPELPYILLCNPNKEELYSLGLSYDTVITKRFNALSEFTCTFPESIDGGETELSAYDSIKVKRLIKVEGFGYFQITDVEERMDGAIPVKVIKSKSLEVELSNKRVSVYSGTKKLYDPIVPSGTILGDMIALAPNWRVGDIDGELIVKFRTFDVADTNIYNFLMMDVASAFECIFYFNTETKRISAKTIENAPITSDIFLSFDNLIETAEFAEKSDEITTCLSVYGGNNLSIRGVNPLGTDKIYNFSYYKNTSWMSSGLVSAITAWEAKIALNQATYTSLLTTLKTRNSELLTLQSELATMESQYTALETVQKVRIEQNLPYADITAQMTALATQISLKQTAITSKQTSIDTTQNSINVIVSSLSFSNNFTTLQLSELNEFIYENTYLNENIIQLDSMTVVQVQDAQQDLYDQATDVLVRVSQPRYEFSMQSANFIGLQEYSVFTAQTDVGTVVTAELKREITIESVLLELSYDFNDPEKFEMKFSNRLRLDDHNFIFSDLIGSAVGASSSVSFKGSQWSNWNDNYKDDVSTFITSSLNATLNKLINGTNQEIVIDTNGLKGRRKTGSTYDPKQVWLTSSILAFTDNNWSSAKLALGNISVPGGGTAFGLVADVIVGRMVAGNNLRISNSANNFILDNTGAFLNNASFTLTTGKNKILLDPTNAIKIQQNVGGSWIDKFSVDTAGNVIFAGTLSAATGSFSGSITANSGTLGGWSISSTGISDVFGNYIRSNGEVKLGALSISGSVSRFDGTIYADKIFGEIGNPQITNDFDASKLTFGTIGASVITTGEIQWAGDVRMYPGGYGWAIIETPELTLRTPNLSANISLSNGYISIDGDDSVFIGASTSLEIEVSNLWVKSPLTSNWSKGENITLDPSTLSYMTFVQGILVEYG